MRHDVTKVETSSVKFSMDAQCFNVRSKMEAPWTFDTRKMPRPPPKKNNEKFWMDSRDVKKMIQMMVERYGSSVSLFQGFGSSKTHQNIKVVCGGNVWSGGWLNSLKKTPNWVGKI